MSATYSDGWENIGPNNRQVCCFAQPEDLPLDRRPKAGRRSIERGADALDGGQNVKLISAE
jgi:hypothetical protein